MNKVSIESLKPDSYINKPVYLDEQYILLSPDVTVSNELIERLRKWDYQEIHTDGIPFEGGITNNIPEGTSTAILEISEKEIEAKNQSQKFFDECVKFLVKYYDNFRSMDVLPLLPVSDKVKDIIAELRQQKHLLLNVNPQLKESDSY
ncbi:MAG: hypothetical protein KAR21_10800, partial [Spirochaetales bacterium]|nr:hypothetical protein [Spirochaetales bacterium]